MAEGTAGEIITTPAQLNGLVEHLRAMRPVRPRYRVCLRRHVRADPVPDPGRDSRAAGGDRSPGGSRPRPVLGAGERPVDRSRHARRRRGSADLPCSRPGRCPRRVFDVQMAAGTGRASAIRLSLVNLVAQVLGISLAGSETRTDWRHRPLSAAQLDYALDDVRYLLDLADHFAARLAQLGRTAWAEAEFEDLLDSVAQRAGRRSLAAAARPASSGPPQPGDGSAARRLARGRGPAAEPPAAPGLARRSAGGHRQAAAHESPRARSAARLQPARSLEPEPGDPGDSRRGPGRPRGPASRARAAQRGATRPLDDHQPALRRSGAVLCAKPDRRLDRGQRRRSQGAGPLVSSTAATDHTALRSCKAGAASSAASSCSMCSKGDSPCRVVDPESEFPVAVEPVPSSDRPRRHARQAESQRTA